MNISPDTIKKHISQTLIEQGFCSVGFAKPQLKQQDKNRITQFINNQEYGTMQWMAKQPHRRIDPKQLMPNAKSIIIAAINYAPNENPLTYLNNKNAANISVYARNNDYHDVIKKKLRICARSIAQTYKCQVKIFTDTAPLAEKPLTAATTIGWQGKHTNIVSKQFGSWLFLAEIMTDLEIPPDKPQPNICGSCQKCLTICPTNAFTEPFKLDARKCISYLTIEHDGDIPIQYRKAIGNRIYGCDDCLAICPWNKFAKKAEDNNFHARQNLNNPPLTDFLNLNETQFRTLFSKSPIKRIGYVKFMRNVLIACGNSNNKNIKPLLKQYLNHPAQTIKNAAKWADNQLKKLK